MARVLWYELKVLVDEFGLGKVVKALAEVCRVKEQHVSHDEELAAGWRKASVKLDKIRI